MQGGRSRGVQPGKDIGGDIIKREIVSFLRHFFRRHSSARRTAGVGVENALRFTRSRPILTILPSYHVYFRYNPQRIINQFCFILLTQTIPRECDL